MENRKIVVPGEIIVEGEKFLAGDFVRKENEKIIASRYGLVEIEGLLVKVIPLSGAYIPRKGNLVIGSVLSITYNGWILDLDSHYKAFLSLNEFPKFVNKGELREYLDYGDVVYAKITEVQGSNIELSLKFRGCGKLKNGQLINVNPYKVPRIIGKEGSMVNLIKKLTNTNIIIGQNGVISVEGKEIKDELKAIKIIKFVEENSFLTGLTDLVEKYARNLEEKNE
ncbi:MAG: exosome complex RNA-binding protein Rrp4 [Candidatus Pacearchaeota archaeon]